MDVGSGISVAGDLTIEGPFTTDVAQIQTQNFALRGSCTLTRSDVQTIISTSLTLGESSTVGTLQKAQGDLSVKLSDRIITHGEISVPNGVFDVLGKSANIYSPKIEAASINFHGFTGNVINLVVELNSAESTQALKATIGELKLDGKVSKEIGKLEMEGKSGIVINGDSINAGQLLVSSFIQTLATQIVVSGNMEFLGELVLLHQSRTELNVGENEKNVLKFHKKVTKAVGDLVLLNRLGKTFLLGDVILSDGSLEINSKTFIYGTLSASTKLLLQNTVYLIGQVPQKIRK
eukprot:TRINITY_DN473_c0_g1_i2.p1 TRINITY_DN473_c0_g1~~TRINITY_DN473_c0_g1_i2.p1  ORF type:complete len:320 (-),score=46.88 TRINITY_DN473_c0_g1_i2:227-1102(-)